MVRPPQLLDPDRQRLADDIDTKFEASSETAIVLRSIPGIRPVASIMLNAEMPELDAITCEQAAALAPVGAAFVGSRPLRTPALQCGTSTPKRHLSTSTTGSMTVFTTRLRNVEDPHKVIITAIDRTLATRADALGRSRQK